MIWIRSEHQFDRKLYLAFRRRGQYAIDLTEGVAVYRGIRPAEMRGIRQVKGLRAELHMQSLQKLCLFGQ